jgi:hypothetical protein
VDFVSNPPVVLRQDDEHVNVRLWPGVASGFGAEETELYQAEVTGQGFPELLQGLKFVRLQGRHEIE